MARHRPAVIVLDLDMPVVDGAVFARAYRARPGPHAPIVVMTAAHDVGRPVDTIGADAVIAKPFDLEVPVETVERLLRRDGER